MEEYFGGTKRWSDKKLNRVVMFGGLFFVLIFFYAIDRISHPSEYIPKESLKDDTDAYTMMRVFIKEGLKAPSTAEFASMGQSEISKEDQNTWKIKSYVDSQNIFGAMLRTKFTITIRYLPTTNEWEKISLVTN